MDQRNTKKDYFETIGLLTVAEMKDLMSEVGQKIMLCDRLAVKTSDPEYATPERKILNCRRIWALIVETGDNTEIPIANTDAKLGSYFAYLAAFSVRAEEILPTSVMLWDNRTYQVVFEQTVWSQGKKLLHKVSLKITSTQTSGTQPDAVVPAPTAPPVVPQPVSPKGIGRLDLF